MKKVLLSILMTMFFVWNTSAQKELDDIFDDGDSNANIDIAIGTDLITTIAGTINIYAEIDFVQKIGLQAGIGLVPFGYNLDFSRPTLFNDETYGLNRNISGGFYYNIAGKYIQAYGDAFKWYYYAEFKRWSMTETNQNGSAEISNIKKLKGTFGTGYAYKPFNNIGFDAHLGVFVGVFSQTETGATDSPVGFLNGFDFGLGAYYNF